MTKTRVLGFDFGLTKIGAASGNTETKTCQPLSAVNASRGRPDWRAMDNLIGEWEPGELVIGLPLSLSGEETDMSKRARKFGVKLADRYAIPVRCVDERLSSNAADRILEEITPAGKRRKRRSTGIRDNLSAQLILQTYLSESADE